MSKSDPNQTARVLITDAPGDIRRKIMSAVTDSDNSISYHPRERPGVSNLLDILSVFDAEGRTPQTLAESLETASLKDLKALVAESAVEGLAGVSERFTALMDDSTYLDSVEADGAARARSRTAETMRAVKDAIGL